MQESPEEIRVHGVCRSGLPRPDGVSDLVLLAGGAGDGTETMLRTPGVASRTRGRNLMPRAHEEGQ
jgi:hypothetical protein